MSTDDTQLVLVEQIEPLIRNIRGRNVLLDNELAALYGVPTKALNQAIKRNRERFPDDFMFQPTREEFDSLRSQFVTSNRGRGGRRSIPFAGRGSGKLGRNRVDAGPLRLS